MWLPTCLVLLAGPWLPPQEGSPSAFEDSGPEWVERRLAAMGTWLEVRLRGADRAATLAASERAVRAIEACEMRLSTWRADSELARLNRAPLHEAVELSPELADDLARAARLWRLTDGAFDPGMGALVRAWGLRTGGRQPSSEELAAARAVGGFSAFELEGRRAVRHHAGATIEEGGFGKGLGLDQAVAALIEVDVTEAVIDLGGQIVAFGGACVVTLADPLQRRRPVLELRFDSGSLATSGNSEHGILVDGVRRGHLLDPRTGEPAEDFGTLSVWASDATTADGLSTGLYVLGPEAAFRWQARHPECELLVLLPRDGGIQALASPGWRGRLRSLVPELQISFFEEAPFPPGPTEAAGFPR